jgi:hypothetical protein
MILGGKEGRSNYLWFKSDGTAKEEYKPIKGSGAHDYYQASINDTGCKLRVLCTPVREDGAQGKPCAAETDIIKLGKLYRISPKLTLM